MQQQKSSRFYDFLIVPEGSCQMECREIIYNTDILHGKGILTRKMSLRMRKPIPGPTQTRLYSQRSRLEA